MAESLLVGDVVLVVPHSIYWINIQHFSVTDLRFQPDAARLYCGLMNEVKHFISLAKSAWYPWDYWNILWFIFCCAELFVSGDKLGDVERARPETIWLNETTLDVWCSLQLLLGPTFIERVQPTWIKFTLEVITHALNQTNINKSIFRTCKNYLLIAITSSHRPLLSPSLLLRSIFKRLSTMKFRFQIYFHSTKGKKKKRIKFKVSRNLTTTEKKKKLLINGFHPALVRCFFTSLCLVVVVVLCVTPEEIVSSFLSTSTFNHLLELPEKSDAWRRLGQFIRSVTWCSGRLLNSWWRS